MAVEGPHGWSSKVVVPRWTPAELYHLLEAVVVADILTALAVLALPWWTYLDDRHDSHTLTGWGGLSSHTWGHGWILLIGSAVAVLGVGLRFRWLVIVAGIVSAAGGIVLAAASANLQSGRVDAARTHAGLWVGDALMFVASIAQFATTAVLQRSQDGSSRRKVLHSS